VIGVNRCAILAVGVALNAAAAAAQAPKITSKGDPSVKDDTIYALAVNPAEHPNQLPALLLEDVVIRLDADGRNTRTIRSVVQILREADVARFAEQSVSYFADHEGLSINWMRILKPTGELISEKAVHPAEKDGPPSVYMRERNHRIVSTGVAVGTIVDFSYTKEEKRPYRANDNYYAWTFGSPAGEVKRTRFVYDVPAGVQPVITARNLSIEPVVTEQGGRRTYVWSAQNVPRFVADPFAPDSLARIPRVSVSLPGTWADIGKWYAAIGRGLYDLDGGGENRMKAAIRGARNLEDTVRLIHKWIAQIPPSPAAFGMGPYRIRPPIEILAIPASANGVPNSPATDAKEKVHVFIGAAMKMKVEAFPVLVNATGSAEPKNPSVQQFNTVIAAVKRPDGTYAFADFMARGFTKYGELPVPMQGGFGLLVKPNGDVEEVRLPRSSPAERKSETVITATLSDSGFMSGTISDVRTGDGWESVRETFGVPGTETNRMAGAMRQHLARLPGATGSEYRGFDGRDVNALMAYTTKFSHARVSAPGNGGDVLTVPIPPLPVSQLLAVIQSRGTRTTPIDASRMLFSSNTTQELTLTLPAGWTARTPGNVVATSDFGSYSVTYTQSGNTLRIVRKMEPGQGVFPPSRMPEVVAWLTAIRADESNRTILLEHPGR
jgi:hypothetical protein